MTSAQLCYFNYRISGFTEPLDFEYDANTPEVDQFLDQSNPEDKTIEQDDEVGTCLFPGIQRNSLAYATRFVRRG